MPRRRAAPIVLLLAFFLSCAREPQSATLKDDLGRSVAVPPRVARVITLAPNLTEIVYAVGAGSRLAGTDDFSNHPPEAKRLPKVGGMQPNVEKIVQLAPDLVLASTEGNHPNLARALDAAKIPLFVVRTDRVEEIAPAMLRIGALLDAPRDEEAVRALAAGIAAQKRARTPAPRVLFAVWTDPLYVAGRGTFVDDLYALTGAENAVAIGGWPQYSLETLVAAPPDVLLYPRGSVTPEQVSELLRRAPGIHPRVVAVDQDVFQRPGPRVVEAAKALNAILDAGAPAPTTP